MIGATDVEVSAGRPWMGLGRLAVFTGSAMTLHVRGVPASGDGVTISGVAVAVENTAAVVVSVSAADSDADGVWTATIPASHFAATGSVAQGVTITASGTDETGAARTWVLGKGDLDVLDASGIPTPGETLALVKLRDALPESPEKGDMYNDPTAGWMIYTGEAWSAVCGVKSVNGKTGAVTLNAADVGAATPEDATLTERGFSEWTITAVPEGFDPADVYVDWGDPASTYGYEAWYFAVPSGWFWTDITDQSITSLASDGFAATRTALSGYQLGSDTNHILASEAEAEALRTGKQNALSAQQLANIAAVPGKANASDMDVALSQKQDRYTAWHVEVELPAPNAEAVGQPYWDSVSSVWTQKMRYSGDGEHWTEIIVPDETGGGLDATSIAGNLAFSATRSAIIDGKANRASPATAGNLAALDANGNPTDSLIPAANVALKGEIPYSLGTPTIIDTASSETVEGETVYYGAATLADRTANIVGMVVALDELRVTIPPAVSGKVRDFGLYVAVGSGEGTALAAPALVPVAPTGETITIMNAEGEMPTLADGTTTKSGTTVLYFTEVVNGVFLVKGEQVEEVA